MPLHKQPYKFGNLFVIFKVTFPDQLKELQVEKIGLALASQKKQTPTGGDTEMETPEVCEMKSYQEHHRNTHHEGGEGGNGSDEEGEEEGHGHGGRQNVRCAQQ